MTPHAWLIFDPADPVGGADAMQVTLAARQWLSTLPGEIDRDTEAVERRPNGCYRYRVLADRDAWLEWVHREGLNILCSEAPQWPVPDPDSPWREPPMLERMREGGTT